MKHKFLFIFFSLLPALCAAGWQGGEWREDLYATAYGNVGVHGSVITKDPSFSAPLFVVEGFDMDHGAAGERTCDDVEALLSALPFQAGSVKQQLLDRGYTLIIVDLENNWDDLKRQAYALGELVNSVWARSPKTEPIKLVGFSMGGLLTTTVCGIREYYRDNPGVFQESWEAGYYSKWNFTVNLNLAYDSPHTGAFIPRSVWGFISHFNPISSSFDHPYGALTCISANQMLIDPFNETTDAIRWKSFYPGLLTYLKSKKGGRPYKFTGITNGNWNGRNQYSNPVNSIAYFWEYNPDGWGGAWAELRIQGSAPGSKVYYGKYQYQYKRAGWFNDTFEESEMTLWDNGSVHEWGPGSYRSTYATLDEKIREKYSNSQHLDMYTSKHTFIPTFSAAALPFGSYSQSAKWNLEAAEAGSGPMENQSPMDKIYHHSGLNQEHVFEFNPENVGWLMDEVLMATTRDYVHLLSSSLNN